MSYNVFVVDDEPMIRYGLISCIAWEEEGLKLIGEAGNGQAALQKLQSNKVDILITDIKMPLMDGLELIRHVKKQYPDVQAILISSFSDFEYAREAVKLGVVVDYLLKPTMEPEDLLAIVRDCRAKLDEKMMQQQEAHHYIEHEEKIKLSKLEGELKSMLSGAGNQITWIPEWLKQSLIAAVWKLDSAAADADDAALDMLLQLETAMGKLAQWLQHSITFITGDHEFILLLVDKGGLGFSEVESAHRRLLNDYGLCFTVGISPAFHRIQTISDACRWARLACNEAFFEGKGKCYLGHIQSAKQQAGGRSDLAQPVESPYTNLREQFSKAFANADQETSESILDAIFQLWMAKKYDRADIMLQAQSLLTIMWSRNYKLKSEQMMKGIIDKLQDIHRIATLIELIQFFKKEHQLQWSVEQVDVIPDESGSAHIIQLALSYIQENYRMELSLQKVADHVHMSKNYFSEQFKRRTGLNYIDFVIRLRIHYARHLLASTSLRIHDIGLQSGFNTPKHFLKLFKREVGCTPAEYREQKAGER